MTRKQRSPSLERAKTDDSLREERENTDDAIRGNRKAAERDVEGVIGHARAVADAVVKVDRLEAGEEPGQPAPQAEAGPLAGTGDTADRALRGQRAGADQTLRSGIKDRAEALEALLVHERAATDAYLLTERARSDEDVSNRDDFLGMVAHDVRNLLNLVVLTLGALKQGEHEPAPEVATATARIRRYVARMNRLVGDLVDVTSIDAGKLAVEPVEGDGAGLIQEATDAFAPAAVEKGVALIADIPAGPLLAVFDHERILQVFANLLSNAIKFTPRGGDIRVGVEEARGMLRFCVSDTGVGIAAPMLESIFERFWQVGRNDRRGMGLGLYISKCIVESHRGRIWAESTPGKGSKLYFTLPVKGSPRRSSAKTVGTEQDRGRPPGRARVRRHR